MGWAIGYDDFWKRDIGYGVPALCDHPDCSAQIDRGLACVCGREAYGGEEGCGLYFCHIHMPFGICERCSEGEPPFTPKPDLEEWTNFKMTDPSWAKWRKEQAEKLKGKEE